MADTMDGLQFNPVRLNNDALGALAADTAVQLNQAIGSGSTQSFLAKRIKYALGITDATDTDGIIIGIASGSATVAEIQAALTVTVSNPDDAGSKAVSANKRNIWWETVRYLHAEASQGHIVLNEDISLGGGKGIPMKEADGFQLFAYNPSTAALTTGMTVQGLLMFSGVWLKD